MKIHRAYVTLSAVAAIVIVLIGVGLEAAFSDKIRTPWWAWVACEHAIFFILLYKGDE